MHPDRAARRPAQRKAREGHPEHVTVEHPQWSHQERVRVLTPREQRGKGPRERIREAHAHDHPYPGLGRGSGWAVRRLVGLDRGGMRGPRGGQCPEDIGGEVVGVVDDDRGRSIS